MLERLADALGLDAEELLPEGRAREVVRLARHTYLIEYGIESTGEAGCAAALILSEVDGQVV